VAHCGPGVFVFHVLQRYHRVNQMANTLPLEPTLIRKMLSWPVVGTAVVFILGGGLSFTTSAHPVLADVFYVFGAALFVVKFLTWEENRQQPINKRRKIFAVGVGATVLVLSLSIWGNHRLNPRIDQTKTNPVSAVPPMHESPPPPAATSSEQPSTPRTVPEKASPLPKQAKLPKKTQTAPQAQQSAQGGVQTGSISTGPCSNVQVGGANNSASTNCNFASSDPYVGSSNKQVSQWAMDEADKIEKMGNDCTDGMIKAQQQKAKGLPYNSFDAPGPEAVQSRFRREFDASVKPELVKLHDSINLRLGPAARTRIQEQDYQSIMSFSLPPNQSRDLCIMVGSYAQDLRQMATSLNNQP
jgi:hypothetical protein